MIARVLLLIYGRRVLIYGRRGLAGSSCLSVTRRSRVRATVGAGAVGLRGRYGYLRDYPGRTNDAGREGLD
jgi:hypothetical protein